MYGNGIAYARLFIIIFLNKKYSYIRTINVIPTRTVCLNSRKSKNILAENSEQITKKY